MLSFNQFIITEEKKNSDIQDFIKFAASKLNLKDLPTFDLEHDAHSYRSFGGYSEDGIGVATKNRHTMDVCRTIAHELVHYKQDKDGKLKYDGEDGKAGSPMENEANAKAAVIMRAWADERPELFKESCWDGYEKKGMKKKGNRVVPNCVPIKEEMSAYPKEPIGWWRDGKSGGLILHHGTHERNIPSMLKHGLNKPDPTTGMISTTPDPNTAHGYAAMSAAGGEREFMNTQFRKQHNLAVNTPHEERAVVTMRIPKEWAEKHIDPQLRGNLGVTRDRMLNKSHYDNWKKENPEKSDSEYYTGSEVRFSHPIPPEFITGVSKRFPNGLPKKKTKPTGRRRFAEEVLNERGEDSKGYRRSTESGAGLTAKGAAHYRAQNPGSKLSTAVTEKNPEGRRAARRKSFCARMSGVPGPMKDEKGRPTRKAMSLRRWRC